MQKRYSKPHEKDLLEEILNRNRKMLSKRALRNSSKTKKTTDRTNKSANTGAVNTIFKSIGHRKNSDSLDSALRYVLKNTDTLENEMGELIYGDKVIKEISRFDLIPDYYNLKDPNKPISEDNLKSRQMWHSIFSLPAGKVNIDNFKSAIREVMSEEFTGHKYEFGVHNNTDNVHAHLIIKEKNDLSNKKLRIGTKDLYSLNRKFQEACIKHGISVDKSQSSLVEYDIESSIKPKNKQAKKKKLPPFYYQKVSNFAKMYAQDSFTQLETNKSTTARLKKLGMDNEHINMFLNLYAENKSLATGAINENPSLFNIKKPKEKFNLRKMEVYEKGTMETMNSNSKSKHSKGVER